MRPLLAVAVLALVFPAAAAAKVDRTVTYLTIYQGEYQFTDYFNAVDYAGRSTVYTQNDSYAFDEQVADVLKPRPGGGVSERRTTSVAAQGSYEGVSPTTTPSTKSCTYLSTPGKAYATRVPGAPEGLTSKGNPLIPYSWTLPETAGELGLSSVPVASCASRGQDMLAITPRSAGTFGAVLQHTAGLSEAFGGSAAVRYRSMPVERPIKVDLENRIETANGGYEQARVTITGTVRFLHLGDPRNRNKVGTLLLDDALKALGVKASATGSPMSDGDSDTVFIPGVTPGTVTLDVTGVVQGSKASAASATPLFSGKATIKGKNPVLLRLTPSPAARSLHGAAHSAMTVRLSATFKPAGRGKATRRSRTGTLSARER